jgi:HlyD family secretion protein
MMFGKETCMDRELSKSIIHRQNIRKIFLYSIPVLLMILVVFMLKIFLTTRIKYRDILTATSETGSVEGTIIASGVIIPEHEQLLSSPFISQIDSVFLMPGDPVIPGQSILKLNRDFVMLELNKLKEELSLQINKETQLQLSMERELIDLESERDIMKLKVAALCSEVETQEHIVAIGAGIQGDLDQARLNLKISELQFNQLEKRISNFRKSLEADLTELKLQQNIQNNRIHELEQQLRLAEAKSLRAGVITWVNDRLGATVNKGEIIARIANLTSYKVEAKISDTHASKLIADRPIRIRVNNRELSGFIQSVQPTIENGVMTFIVELDEKTNPMLRPNLRCDVFVITNFRQNVVRLKNGPFINGSGEQNIYVIKNNRAFRRTVLIGVTNFDWVEVLEGLQPGEEVIISDTENFKHKNEIKIL